MFNLIQESHEMTVFVRGKPAQAALFPERLDDQIAEENPVRVIDVFVNVPDPESLADRLAILPHC